ncbi:unnamed protein product [Dicrocoelium dendriticum]|nr:unnamed protein product [Dicrocoelium dendriticum]
MRFGRQPRRGCDRIETSKLTKQAFLDAYQRKLSCELDKRPLDATEAHWSPIHQTLLAAGHSACGISNLQHEHWISSESPELIDARGIFRLDADTKKLAMSSG